VRRAPEVIAAQIVEDATAGIKAFATVAAELAARNSNGDKEAATEGGTGVDEQQDAINALLSDADSAR